MLAGLLRRPLCPGSPCVRRPLRPAAPPALLVLCELTSTVAEKLCWRFPGLEGARAFSIFSSPTRPV